MLKIEISINIEIAFFIILFILTKQIKLYLLFFLFVLIHEITHMITGLILGLKPKKLMIMPFGFKMQFQEVITEKKVELKRIVIALAGPIINLIIIGLACIFKLHINYIYINLAIALFNLLPIYPLDGGRVLKSILNINMENDKAYKIVNRVANISIIVLTALTSILILYIKNIGIIFALAYLWYVVIRENKKYIAIRRIYDVIENK